MSTISFQRCDVPPATIERRRGVEEQVPGIPESGIPFDRFEKIPPAPPNGDYWEIVLLDGEPVSPEAAVSALVRRIAVLEDSDNANDVVEWLREAALLRPITRGALALGHEVDRYNAVPATAARVVRSDRIDAVLGAAGLTEDSKVAPGSKVFLTSAELATLFRVDDSTIRRWAGSKLPGATKVGKKWLFKVDAVLSLLHGGPHDVPADPLAEAAA